MLIGGSVIGRQLRRGWDLNPRTLTGRGSRVEAILDFDRDKNDWIEWIKTESPSSLHKYKSKLERYLGGKKINTPEELREIVESIPPLKSRRPDRHAFNAIRNYIRYLEKKGKIRRSQADDFRAVVPNIKSGSRSESEKAVSAEDIIKAYKSITPLVRKFKDYVEDHRVKRIRQVVFKLLLFTGLREVEVFHLITNFDREVIEKSIKAFGLEKYADKLAVYDLETIKIPTRKHATKRGYIAIFPKELVPEIEEIKRYNLKLSYGLFRKREMFDGFMIDLSLLRKYHYNFFNDNALKVPDMPSDIYRIIEFMQGRTHKEVGGRNYRANVQTAVRLYYGLIDMLKDKFKEIILTK